MFSGNEWAILIGIIVILALVVGVVGGVAYLAARAGARRRD